jgi:hypothetical protein
LLYRLILLFSLFSVQLSSQVIDVIEFDGDIDVMVPPPNRGECDDTQGVFGIENEAFVIREKEGSICCDFNNLTGNNLSIGTIGPYIFTEAYCNVTITLNTIANGALDECVGIGVCLDAFSGADEMEVQVTLHGSTFPIGSYCGGNIVSAFTRSFDEVGPGSAVFFTVTGGTQDEDEEYIIESITIEGTPKDLVSAQINSNGDDDRLCEGTDVLVLNAIPADGVDYDWVGPNGDLPSSSSSVGFSDLITPADAGLYTVTITEAGGCTSTAEITIEVIGLDQKDVESRFPFVSNTYCTDSDDLVLPIAAAPEFTRTGTWNVMDPLDFSGLSDSTLLVFTYDDDATDPDSMYLRIDTLPSVGNNLGPQDICATSDMPLLDLVDLLDLNLDNISSVIAFGNGRSKNELFNIDVSGIPPGADVISITAIPNGSCGEETYIVPIMFELIELGQNNVLNFCEEEAQIEFPDFTEALHLSNNATGIWRDVNNSGIDLSSPSGVDISTLETGVYDYEYIVDEMTICGIPVRDTALLRLIIQPDLSLEITTASVEITCDDLSDQIQFDFDFPFTNYMIDLVITDESGIEQILDSYESVEESHFINVSTTDGENRIEGNTLFLNSSFSDVYTISVASYNASISSMCPVADAVGQTEITFDNVTMLSIDTTLCEGETFILDEVEYTVDASESVFIKGENGCDTMYALTVSFESSAMIPIDTLLCEGDVFSFRGVNYSDPLAEFPVTSSSGDGCDTTFLLSLQFSPGILEFVEESICEGDIFSFKGTDYSDPVDGLVIDVPGIVGCDTTFILSLQTESATMIQDEVDPCIGEGSFRGINVTSDTLFTIVGSNGRCDTLFEIFYSPTVAPDSLFQDERCENDPVTINGVLYDVNNPTGSYMITTAEGCMQTVNVIIAFEAGVFEDLDTLLCEGAMVNVGGEIFDENRLDGEVIFPEASSTGCDSIVFVSLEYIESEEYVHPVELCPGQSITQFGIVVDENTGMDESFAIGPNLCDTLLRFDVSLRSISVASTAQSACVNENNGSLKLVINDGVGPYTIDVDGEVTQSNSEMVTLDALSPGDYLIQVTDASGCVLSELLTVDTSIFELDFTSTQNAQGGLNLEVRSDQTITSVSWSPPTGLSCDDCTSTIANPEETTIYTVTAFDDNGCTQSISVEVIINNNPTEDFSYYIPTAFSPINAGNDRFYLQSPEGLVISYDMSIYSRNGEKMYEVIDAIPNIEDFGWDGRKSGAVLNPDVFVYHIVMRIITGETIMDAGDILLIR